MIRRLLLKNFKCFEELTVEMAELNVFAGINSMGKSTAIQALLLLRQAYKMNSLGRGIYLNGELTNIGTGFDLLYRNSQTDKITIGIEMDSMNITNEYEYSAESDFQKIASYNTNFEEIIKENLFSDNFAYVSSERKGPQKYYGSSYHDIFEENQVGTRGEYFAGYIAERGTNEKVTNKAVLHPQSQSDFLIYQMEAWMSELSPGIHFTPKKYKEAGIVNLEYTIATESYSPVNVGFGLSYVAPIVLSLLKAQKGDLVIIENPEAHLHPKGQRKMGELIARTASGGVQVLVETHSDHFLNGIRLAVKKKQIAKDAIRLNYFFCSQKLESNMSEIKHEKCSPMILEDGSLSDWPEGFFDEWDKALEELF